MSAPLTIFVYEHLTSGACIDESIASSLMVEGRAMVEAVIADIQSLDDVQVVTMRDGRLPALQSEGVDVYQVTSRDEVSSTFNQLCGLANRILIIAPESDGLLADRLQSARTLNSVVVMNCSDRALEIGCDKWELARFCQQHDIPHIPTSLWVGQGSVYSSPIVIKPREGAGCEEIVVVSDDGSIPVEIKADGSLIVQPLLSGLSLSSAACFSSDGELMLRLPLGEQLITIGQSIEYQGGTIPWRHMLSGEANRQANEIWSTLEQQLIGLRGYVGVDWLWEEKSNTLRLVELNPRLTSSYVGYRQLFGNEIVKAIMGMPFHIEGSDLSAVSFLANGIVTPAESMTGRI